MNSEGHRANILRAEHNRVGLGLSKADSTCSSWRVAFQEFVDNYGEFDPIPKRLPLPGFVKVQGSLTEGTNLYSVDIGYEPLPRSMSPRELNDTYSYSCPKSDFTVLAKHVPGDSNTFSLPLLVGYAGPGVYYIRVWADSDHGTFVASQRTVVVNNKKGQ